MRIGLLVPVVALLLCAGCSSEPEQGALTPRPSTSTATSAPSATPTAKPTTVPRLTVPQYQAALTNSERALRPYVVRLMNSKSLAEFAVRRAQLEGAVRLQRQALAKVVPPRTLDSAHQRVLAAFDSYPSRLDSQLEKAGETKTSCGLTRPETIRLYWARSGVWGAASAVARDVGAATGKSIKFGTQLVPPSPKPPALLNARGGNGKVIQRSGARGPGRLQITNNSSADVVIVVTNSNPRKPQASIYVRANNSATLRGIRGNYYVYFKSGSAWDAANRRFLENCSYERYEQIFSKAFDWQISLARTPLGNAPTSEVDAF
ncbi:hypothetical protein [Kribbella antiqua]|uniref:hypothetical protein n=1 Tax=Kribbella antiqua TaxID=2512217 RepID=UPI001043D167|nr:hypothetical protein [Kribbella antiqua]